MDQHKLYRTILTLGDEKFRNEEALLGHVLENIIRNEEIPIKGGRIWKLDATAGTYRVLRQYGEMDPIDKNFRINVLDYPVFLHLHKKGTILATETNRYLQQKGIRIYSATGVGEKVKWKDYTLYQYVIAINAAYLKDDMAYALNIIGHALTSAVRNRRIESKAKALEADLDKARDIQRSILPEHEVRFQAFDLYGISIPDRVVGGDFFDYLQMPDDKERLGVVVGDAASKGLSAAAQALFVAGALRMGFEQQTRISVILGRLNQLVHRTFTPEQFISMVYVELLSSEKGLVTLRKRRAQRPDPAPPCHRRGRAAAGHGPHYRPVSERKVPVRFRADEERGRPDPVYRRDRRGAERAAGIVRRAAADGAAPGEQDEVSQGDLPAHPRGRAGVQPVPRVLGRQDDRGDQADEVSALSERG